MVCPRPRAMLIKPRRPSRADQPMTCRPSGPLRSGCLRVRQDISTNKIGQTQGADHPDSPLLIKWPRGPGRPHQNSAATTSAHANRNKPTPSRRKAGSMSNDSPRTRRVASPSPPAKAIQIRAIPRPNAPSTEDRFAARDFRGTEMWIERMGRCAPVRHADGNVSSSFRQTAEEAF